MDLDKSIKIQVGGKPIHLSQIGSLHQALRHLPLPVSTYHYSKNAIANLLSFAKLADNYYIICNTRIDGTIYVQSKDDGKTYVFRETISLTYTTWTLARLMVMNIVTLIP